MFTKDRIKWTGVIRGMHLKSQGIQDNQMVTSIRTAVNILGKEV